MSWIDKLQPGRFREAEFVTDSVQSGVGRRIVTHEYPGRDKPYTEDLGRAARNFQFDAYVIGADYMDKRDKLIKALEKGGSALLVHPYWGRQQVNLNSCTISESTENGGMARFSFDFIESGINDHPSQEQDTARLLDISVSNVLDAAIGDFASNFAVAGFPSFVAGDAVSMVTGALDSIASAQSLIGNVQNTLSNPLGLVSDITGAVSKVTGFTGLAQVSNVLGRVSGIRKNINDAVLNPFELGINMVSAISEVNDLPGLKQLSSFAGNASKLVNSSPMDIIQGKNRQAVIDIVKTASTVQTARQLVAL